MRVQLVIVTDDTQDEDVFAHGLEFEMPEVPRVGECVVLSRPDQAGSTSFIVTAVHWGLKYPEKNLHPRADAHVVGEAGVVTLECEFVLGPSVSEEHKQSGGADAK